MRIYRIKKPGRIVSSFYYLLDWGAGLEALGLPPAIIFYYLFVQMHKENIKMMKDYVEVEVTGTALAAGTHHEGVLPLADYGRERPWSVCPTWELFE